MRCHRAPIAVLLLIAVTASRASGSGGHEHGKQHAHPLMSMPAASAPSLELTLEEHESGALSLRLATDRFRFSKEHVDGEHIAGEGHAHLYVDGKKIGRIYEPRYQLDATGLPGGGSRSLLAKRAAIAKNVSIHGTSPWHFGSGAGRFA